MRLSELLVSIGLEAKGLRKLNQQLGETQRKFRRTFGNIQKSVQAFGQSMTRTVTMPLAGIAMGAVKASADLEKLEVSFISLTGGAEQAAAMMKNLNAFTARTPFQIENVANAARQLIASGTEVSQVNDQLQFLGDIAATSGVSIEEIAAIFAKVNAKGKVELENLNQLAERGIPIFKALADATGLPADKLGAGAVSVEQFNETLKGFAKQGGFASGAMDRLSQTAAGKLSTALDNLKLAGAELVESLMPHIHRFLETVTNIAQGFTRLSSETKATVLIVAGLLGAAGPIAMGIAALMPIIASITGPVGLVAAAFGALALLIVRNFEHVEPAIINLVNAVIRFQNKTKILGLIFNLVKTAISKALRFIELKFQNLMTTLSSVGKAIQLAFSGNWKEAGKALADGAKENQKRLIEFGVEAGQDFAQAVDDALNAEPIAELEPGAISTWVEGIKSDISNAFTTSGPVTVPVVPETPTETTTTTAGAGFEPMTAMAPWFTDDNVVARADANVTKVANTMQMLGDQMRQVGGAFSDAFTSAFDVILEGGDNMSEQLTNIGRQLMMNLIKIAVGNAIAAAFSPLSADNAASGGLAGIAKSAFLQGLIPSMMPKLARGGLAYGPTTAIVGDNIGARVDPEVIAPLSKLQGMMGGGQLSGRIAGRDILLTSQRDRNRSRRTFGSFAS